MQTLKINKIMKGVILDRRSFDRDDLDTNPLINKPVTWTHYPSTKTHDTLSRIDGQDIVVTNKVVLDEKSLDSAHNIKLILIAATGTDNVDIAACKRKGITVCNVRHYATPAVAQHTINLMLNLLTNQIQFHNDVQSGAWSKNDVFCMLDYPIVEVSDKTLGIIGFGTLGRRVAEIATALGMETQICQRLGAAKQSGRISFDQILAESDVISLHCPLTPDTYHLISESAFTKMKNESVIINTARGAIIDSTALVNALKNGKIAGAGIDVLDQEPPPPDHPLLAKDIPNLIVTPHNAWATRESRQRLIEKLGENLDAWLKGKSDNVVC